MKLVSPTNKLYKTELFKGLYYPEGKVIEDDYVYYTILDRSKCTVFTDAELYEYRMQDNSITHARCLCVLDLVEYREHEKGKYALPRKHETIFQIFKRSCNVSKTNSNIFS